MPAVEFVEIARAVTVTEGIPRITLDGQSTFMKMCTGECHQMMPHVRRDDYSECVLCGKKTYAVKPENNGQANRLGWR